MPRNATAKRSPRFEVSYWSLVLAAARETPDFHVAQESVRKLAFSMSQKVTQLRNEEEVVAANYLLRKIAELREEFYL